MGCPDQPTETFSLGLCSFDNNSNGNIHIKSHSGHKVVCYVITHIHGVVNMGIKMHKLVNDMKWRIYTKKREKRKDRKQVGWTRDVGVVCTVSTLCSELSG